MSERVPSVDLHPAPAGHFLTIDAAAKALGVSRKKVETACSAYRRRMQSKPSTSDAPDPHP